MKKSDLLAFAVLLAIPAIASADVIYSENFNTDVSANWNVNSAGSNAATWAFNYGAAGVNIPAAPHSTDGSTVGLKLEPNYSGGGAAFAPSAVPGFTLAPANKVFSNSYVSISADIWTNYPINGSSSTEFIGLGFGFPNDGSGSPQLLGTDNSVYVASSFDGGSATDYKFFAPSLNASTGGTTSTPGLTFNAGSQNSSNAYYTSAFPAKAYPSGQPQSSSTSTEYGVAGQIGFNWYTWTLTKNGNTVAWSLTDYSSGTAVTTPMATYTLTDADIAGLSGSDIFLTAFDGNSGASTDPNARAILFALVDNLTVTVPEPSSALLAIPAVLLLARRRRA